VLDPEQGDCTSRKKLACTAEFRKTADRIIEEGKIDEVNK
jgi:hypothetical protein